MLFNVTQEPPRIVGNGVTLALELAERLRPKIEINPPGATASVKFAVFTTALPDTEGALCAGTGVRGMMLNPDAVNT